MTFDIHWRREYPLYNSVAYMYGLRSLTKRELGARVTVRVESAGGWMAMMSEGGSKNALVKEMTRRIKENPEYINHRIARVHEEGARFVEIGKKLDVTKPLAVQYSEYFDAHCRYCTQIFTSFYLVEIVSDMFHAYVMEEAPEHVTEVIEAYSAPSERARILQIGDFFAVHPDTEERVTFVKEKYPGLGSIDPFRKPFSDAEFRDFAVSSSPSKPPRKSPVELKDKALVELYQEILYLKDRRDDYRRESFYYGHTLMQALAKELGISIEELSFLLPTELEQRSLIQRRKQAYIATLTDSIHIEDGNVEGAFEHSKETKSASITGTVGAKGKTSGKVQIIRTMEDVASFEKGNILVALTTDPNYISAMQKAAAIVTDEGGIACHAAIVAREMGVPCIVGTGNATRVLKDGEIVEVDASEGVVRKV